MSLEKTKRIKLLQSAFGAGFLESSGKNISFCCPNCKETRKEKKKLVVQLESGWFHCWVCGFSGKNITYLFKKFAPSHLRQCTETFDCKPAYTRIQPDQVIERIDFPLDAKLIVTSNDPDARAIFSYLKSRGLTKSDMCRWRVCFSNEFKFRRKAIFPSFDLTGKINYYVARAIDEVKFKYTNAKVPKSDVIFNEVDIDWSRPVVLVEGVFDAIKCPDNAVPILGSTLPKKAILHEQLRRNLTPVIVALDEDAEEKSHRICSSLSKAGCNVYKTTISGHDLGSMNKEEARTALAQAKKWSTNSMISYKITSIESGSIL